MLHHFRTVFDVHGSGDQASWVPKEEAPASMHLLNGEAIDPGLDVIQPNYNNLVMKQRGL